MTNPKIELDHEMLGTIDVMFLPGGVRIVRNHSDLIEFDMKQQGAKYVYDPRLASSFMNCKENDRADIIVSLEKMVNDWVESHVVEKLNIDIELCKICLERSAKRIQDWERFYKDMGDQIKESIATETKNMEDINNNIRRLAAELMNAKRNSLQKE